MNNLTDLFALAKDEPVVASFGETKELFLNTVGIQPPVKNAQLLTIKNGLIMLVTIGLIVASIVFLPKGEQQIAMNNNNENPVTEEVVVAEESNDEKVPEVEISGNETTEKIMNTIAPDVVDATYILDLQSEAIVIKEKEEFKKPKVKPVTYTEVFRFPKLTEDEIAENHKQKKKMLKAITKMDKKVYAYIPSGTYTFKGNTVSLQSFYMQKNEVSVLEYRTFLFDLLIQNRKDEFLKARPNQAEWTEVLGEDMRAFQDQYFSNSTFNNYPVNNITREGAQMYCKWLTLEAVKYDSKNSSMNDMRIPQRDEWIYAASNGGKSYTYPWGGKLIHNQMGCYLANFDIQQFSGNLDSVTCLKPPTKKKGEIQKPIISDGAVITAKTGTYNPNEFGLYNMSGNVAEMVYVKSKENPGTAGGGWMSSDLELRIDADDTHLGVTDENLNIGFRVVTTFMQQSGK